jgi:hypothetical protein
MTNARDWSLNQRIIAGERPKNTMGGVAKKQSERNVTIFL